MSMRAQCVAGAVFRSRLTVDGDCHGFSQNVTVGALESWDLAQLVELAVVVGDIAGLGGHELDVEVVGFGDGEEGGGASIALCSRRKEEMSVQSSFGSVVEYAGGWAGGSLCSRRRECVPRTSRSFQRP